MDIMELTELSLAPNQFLADKSCHSSSSDQADFNIPSKKRKLFPDHLLSAGSQFQTSVDLQVKDPLPLDWEQCLDLESGKMYYLNRKTLQRTWNWPKDQKLDLELNISQKSNCSEQCSASVSLEDSNKQHSTGTNMVALACLNCHLLVILSKSSPACPNCKYVHSLPTLKAQPPKVTAIKSLDTLSLLN
ncbi:hypothetical protein QUC31_017018 [Theobroma cacao]|uniref:Uncharacterized protein LOC18602513 n=2 Tax=Theobroma cacao TaxID=3641 RepID=A0AB32W6F7_THECC|nr:PREDICTED: uncharacterized protein LOC18602513 [Theobroma cacao]EOY04926.1 Uncharacterized protein TCM_020072 [Theobroma cacao]WRX21284.1 hypothetical protein QQP08_013771 [Theobroma cacao]